MLFLSIPGDITNTDPEVGGKITLHTQTQHTPFDPPVKQAVF